MIQRINDILIEFTDKLGWNTDKLKQDDKAYHVCEAKLRHLFEKAMSEAKNSSKDNL